MEWEVISTWTDFMVDLGDIRQKTRLHSLLLVAGSKVDVKIMWEGLLSSM